MVTKVRMPKVDANVEEAAIGRWLRQVGERIEVGQPLAELVTDKASFELESEHAGFLRRQVATEKSVLPVGYIIALVSDCDDEPLPDMDEENEHVMRRHLDSMLTGSAEPESGPEEAAQRIESPDRAGASIARVKATPTARRRARQEGVRLEDVRPGPGGVIQESDVLDYVRRQAGTQKGGGDAG